MGGTTVDAAQSSHCSRCRSVPHRPARSTRILTSVGPVSGSGTSSSSSPGPAVVFTSARTRPTYRAPAGPRAAPGPAAAYSLRMARYLDVHPVDPQPRAISQAVQLVRDGGLLAYPTDSGYALGCALGNQDGKDRIVRIRHLGDKHHFTLVCRDFAQLGQLVHIDNSVFRAIKAATPGPDTFILPATKEVPRRLLRGCTRGCAPRRGRPGPLQLTSLLSAALAESNDCSRTAS